MKSTCYPCVQLLILGLVSVAASIPVALEREALSPRVCLFGALCKLFECVFFYTAMPYNDESRSGWDVFNTGAWLTHFGFFVGLGGLAVVSNPTPTARLVIRIINACAAGILPALFALDWFFGCRFRDELAAGSGWNPARLSQQQRPHGAAPEAREEEGG